MNLKSRPKKPLLKLNKEKQLKGGINYERETYELKSVKNARYHTENVF